MGIEEIFGLIVVFGILYLIVVRIVIPTEQKIDKKLYGMSETFHANRATRELEESKKIEKISQTNKRTKL